MHVESFQVDVTTAADGTATAFSPVLKGSILTIIYTKDGATPFDNGVDFTITAESSGQNLWTQLNVNASATVAPRQPTHAPDGSALLYAAGGTPVSAPIAVAAERVKIAIAQGGNTKLGHFTVIVG